MKGLRPRRVGAVRDARVIAIAVEGEETGEEFRYFTQLRALLVNDRRFVVELLPTPSDTHHSSPKAVIERLDQYVSVHDLSPQIDVLWLVFDIDTWPSAMLSNVTKLATQKRYGLAISNPCFEIWLLLHFDELNLEISSWPANPSKRSQEAKRILARCREERLEPQVLTPSALHHAIARAEQLAQATSSGQRWPAFPGTSVHAIAIDLRNAQLLPASP